MEGSLNNRQSEPQRPYQQVADQIRLLVQSEGITVGMRLPSERDLAAHLGVSRPSVREALIALEIAGMIEIRLGSGVYMLADRLARTQSMAPMGDSPSDLMQARIAVEGTVSLLAATQIDADGLAALGATLDAMEHEIATGRNPMACDRAFHIGIAARCGNTVLARIVGDLFDSRHSPMSARFQDRFGTVATWHLALAEHRAILAAFEQHDGLLAQASMRMHLEASRQRWLGI